MAIHGGKVCRVHGGSAPQVRNAALQRILAAADPAAARLVEIALSKKSKDSDAIAAIRELLNRASVAVPPPSPAADGTVLWEEFVAIHRERVGNAEKTDT